MLVGSLTTTAALAQSAQPPAAGTPGIDALPEVVVSANRQEQRAFDAPASM